MEADDGWGGYENLLILLITSKQYRKGSSETSINAIFAVRDLEKKATIYCFTRLDIQVP